MIDGTKRKKQNQLLRQKLRIEHMFKTASMRLTENEEELPSRSEVKIFSYRLKVRGRTPS